MKIENFPTVTDGSKLILNFLSLRVSSFVALFDAFCSLSSMNESFTTAVVKFQVEQ